VTASAVALAGWTVAAVAIAALLLARRGLAVRAGEVAEACHELRGPLTAAALGLELAGRQRSLEPGRLRAIELELGRATLALDALESARRIGRRPGRGRSAAGSSAFAEPVSVLELLADSVEASRPAALRRGVELRLRWSGAPAFVPGDRLRLAQATDNLIANAIEHGGGAVEVSGRAGPDGVRIEVRDRGSGLDAPVATLARRSRPSDRHGHGLRVASAVASAHGGRLAAAPSDAGARLVLELPAAPRGPSAQPGLH
jgi:signal transduction histidine kinase